MYQVTMEPVGETRFRTAAPFLCDANRKKQQATFPDADVRRHALNDY